MSTQPPSDRPAPPPISPVITIDSSNPSSRRDRLPKRRRRRGRGVWGAIAMIVFPMLLLGGVLFGLMQHVRVQPQADAAVEQASTQLDASQPAATQPAAATSGNTNSSSHPQSSVVSDQRSALATPAAPPTPVSRTLAGSPPKSIAASRGEQHETLTHHITFESPLPIHGHNSIDDMVFTRLIKEGIAPAKGCSDATFLRRVYVDATGTLPTAEQAQAFLQDLDERKRERLIDELLDTEDYADYWAMKWCDILRVKAEFPINLWPNAAHAYHRWIRSAIADEMPYDEFARELLTASGSNFRKPQVNFYRAMQSKEPEAIAKTVALTFMATRAEKWPAAKLEAMAKFFSKVGFKPTGEWKEEIIFFDRHGDLLAEENESEKHASKAPTTISTLYPSGVRVTIPPDRDPREAFADWMVHPKNPWFSRTVANRVWCWLMGRGIVHPVDDVCPENPASNLELLNHLGEILVKEDFNLKELIRQIMRSSTYQLSCLPASDHPQAGELFAYYEVRRHDAEVLIDAINQITDTSETYMSIVPEPFTWLPDNQRAIAIPDGSITSSFLELFGRPARDSGMADERNNKLTARQALHMLNSNHIRGKIKNGDGLKRLQQNTINSTELAEQIYLTVLSRLPTEEELIRANMMCSDTWSTHELTWALINTDEFLFQH